MNDPLMELCRNGDLVKIKKLIKKYKNKIKWKIAQLERKIQKNEDELEYEYCTDLVDGIDELKIYKNKFQKRMNWALYSSFSHLKNFEEKVNNEVVKYLLTEDAHFDKKWDVPGFSRIGPLEWCIVTNNTELIKSMYDRIVVRKKNGEYINPLFSLQFVRKCFVNIFFDRLELFINLETKILLQVSTESRKFDMIEKILLANPDVFYNKINLDIFLREKTPEIKMYFLKFIYENDLKVSENDLSHLLMENIEFHPQIGKFLIQKGVKAHFLRLTGFDSVELVKAYEIGMNLNITNEHGETLLLASVGNENYPNYAILSSLNIEDKRDRFGTNAKLLIKMKHNLI